MKNKDKIKKIADHYGIAMQINQCMEECAELIVELNKYLRYANDYSDDYRNYAEHVDDISLEIADVKIMVRQMEYFFKNKNDVKEYVNVKLDRQLDRIKNEDSDS